MTETADRSDTPASPGSTEPGEPPAAKPLGRAGVLRRLLDLYESPRYLEIGVCEGFTFDRVEATRKVAVDPEFRFDHVAAAKANPGAEYHQVTSDEYFAQIAGAKQRFDVIYLDGLHTFEQTLRDLMNALHHLQPQGVIVIDDTVPPTYHASIPSMERFGRLRAWLGDTNEAWMGDVYKLVWFIDTFCPNLTHRTISNNHGQTVVWRHRRAQVTERSVTEVGSLSFEQMVLEEDVFGLRPFGEVRRELRRDLGI
ncbi:class I SAM-dependent methyltransferase [Nocardioides sp. R-C-SC26]|uniref:class I SAM-dependent methyltransferase n=1 Tax=Nocardioides sp. R-C-SC26 TaxID=2870414 RepID=UPI001E300C4E|nr:class I SAM-dependent methyltransferase [Nocardioides sp. R-C-SC26]